MSWFLRRVTLIAFPVVEVVLIIWVASIIGWLATLGLLFAGLVIGFLLIRAAGRNAFAMMRSRMGSTVTTIDQATGEATTILQPGAESTPEQDQADAYTVRESGLLVTAGMLVAFPGFITDAFGLVLAIPGVRRYLSHRRPVTGQSSGVVIEGETVVVDDAGVHVTHWESGGQTAPSSPPIIAGEILPPKSPTDPNE